MGKRKVVNKIEAYSGMYINHNRNTYQLVQTDTSSTNRYFSEVL